MDQKNKKIIGAIVGIIVVIVAFFAGKAYGSSHAAAAPGGAYAATGAAGGRYAGGAGMRAGGTGGFGGATMGQVLSKDANSITISLAGGGSKIILYSPTTTVAKSTEGSISDVAVGDTITALGSTNTDGSVTATSIQIRPTGTAALTQNQPAPQQ